MQCGACGAGLKPEAKFCSECGTPTARTCASCSTPLEPIDRFCSQCGTPVAGAAPPESVAPPDAQERRVVSVLFIDLVGFTAFSEGRDPEEVRSLITDYFDLAREVIARFGGTIDKFIGDAVMAWWGATTSNEDDAERAVRAALELADRVRSYGEQVGIPGLTARAAVMTGPVSVGPGGNERGLLLGDLVNTTSRLQSLAPPGGVYVGKTTAELVANAIEVVPAGTHQVKGKEEPVIASQARRVLGERGGRGKSEGLEPPFVGRQSELRLLKDTLHATARDGRARLVSLVGQAGIGKSRLIWEFLKYADGLVEDVFWHEGRSPAYGEGLALWALGEMIRQRAGIQETDPEDVTVERLRGMVTTYLEPDADPSWVTDRLAALLGVGQVVTNERSELFAAARALFEAISQRGTTVMVFEDLQWADPSLLAFIEELPAWSQNYPILVVTLTRPDLLDRRPDWGSGRRGFASVYLSPLTDDEMGELIAGAVPGIPKAAERQIVSAASGIPLFAVEMLRIMLSDGRLVVDGDTVTVRGDLVDLEVPPSVHAIIAARLDRLPSEEREIVRDAAVLGYSFTVEGLAALREETPDKVEHWLATLIRHEILELVRDPRSPERGQYRWLQSVLREVAYGRIARSDRRDLHLRVARYFRDLEDAELTPIAAAHFVSAAEHSTALEPELQLEMATAVRRAIDRAESIHAHEQVIMLVDTALPVAPADMAMDLHEAAAMAATRIAAIDVADRHAEAALELAQAGDDPAMLHRAMALAGIVANETRRADRAVGLLVDHLARFPDLHGDPHLATAAVALARAHLLTGEDEVAARLADEALGAVEHFRLIAPIADAMITRGTVLSADRPHQGMALIRAGIDISRENNLIGTMLRGLINLGYASPHLNETLDASVEALTEAKRVGDRSHAAFVAGNLIGFYHYTLRLDDAAELLEDPVLADTPSDEMQRLGALAINRLYRGADGVEELLERQAALLSTVTDAQARLAVERDVMAIQLLEGDYPSVYETAKRHFDEMPFAKPVAFSFALSGAAMDGRREWLDAVAEMAETISPGTINSPLTEWASLLVALTDGAVAEAVAEADGLLDRLAATGQRLSELRVALSMAVRLPEGHPDAGRFADRARAVGVETGAHGLTAWVDRAVANLRH